MVQEERLTYQTRRKRPKSRHPLEAGGRSGGRKFMGEGPGTGGGSKLEPLGRRLVVNSCYKKREGRGGFYDAYRTSQKNLGF